MFEDKILAQQYSKIFNYGLNPVLDLLKLGKVDKDSDIIDVGCGTGRLLSLLNKNGYKNLYGIEKSKTMFEVAVEKTKDMNGVANIVNMDFLEYAKYNRHDVSIFCFSLHFILQENAIRVLNTLKSFCHKMILVTILPDDLKYGIIQTEFPELKKYDFLCNLNKEVFSFLNKYKTIDIKASYNFKMDGKEFKEMCSKRYVSALYNLTDERIQKYKPQDKVQFDERISFQLMDWKE
jgi:SAM-dependent methyltransferase